MPQCSSGQSSISLHCDKLQQQTPFAFPGVPQAFYPLTSHSFSAPLTSASKPAMKALPRSTFSKGHFRYNETTAISKRAAVYRIPPAFVLVPHKQPHKHRLLGLCREDASPGEWSSNTKTQPAQLHGHCFVSGHPAKLHLQLFRLQNELCQQAAPQSVPS